MEQVKEKKVYIRKRSRVQKLWDKLARLPAIQITYEDGQQILWIMLRKEDFEKAVKEIYSKKEKEKKIEAKTR